METTGKQYDVRDTKLQGLIIRVSATGKMHYVCQYKRGRRKNIGSVHLWTPAQAREKTKEILGDAVKGVYPDREQKQCNLTLQTFIDNEYMPWSKIHHKSALESMKRIKRCFLKKLGDYMMQDILPLVRIVTLCSYGIFTLI